MSTSYSHTLSKDFPIGMATVAVKPRTYWDATNKRWKSGRFDTLLSGISWSYSGGGSEQVRLTAILPNGGPGTFTKWTQDCTISSGSATISYLFKTAINYGNFGPSARLNPDGSVSTVDLLVELLNGANTACTSLQVALSYSTGFTDIDPRSSLSGFSGYSGGNTHTLAAVEGRAKSYGIVGLPSPVGNIVGIQLTALDSTISKRPQGVSSFQAVVAGDPSVKLLNTGLSPAANGGPDLTESFTYLFAVNDGKYDENCAVVTTPGGNVNAGLLTSLLTPSDGAASAQLTYDTINF